MKAATSGGHNRLDDRLGALIGSDTRDYAQFLAIQYRARVSVEEWLIARCAQDAPPSQTGLLTRDLSELGMMVPAVAPPFHPPEDADPLGVCWVMAGSSLGNRAVLARIAKTQPKLPVSFLSDTRMTDYWHRLRPSLERLSEMSADRALVAGAQAAFAHFNAVTDDSLAMEAA